MHSPIRSSAVVLVLSGSLIAAACGKRENTAETARGDVAVPASASAVPAPMTTVDTPSTVHHSKVSGALVGAAAGHMLGHHAVLGAAAGALIQHERNKHQP